METQQVLTIDDLSVVIEKSLPPNWIISGECTTRSAPKGEAVLRKIEYVQPPEDGVQDFLCLVWPNDEAGAQVLTPGVKFQASFDQVPSWCRGVRIHAAANTKEWPGAGRAPDLLLFGFDGKPISGISAGDVSTDGLATSFGGTWPFPGREGMTGPEDGESPPNDVPIRLPRETIDVEFLLQHLVDDDGSSLLTAESLRSAQAWRCEEKKLARYYSHVQFRVRKMRLYKKRRITTHTLKVCYVDPLQSIERCLKVGFAAAIAAFAVSGGAAAGAAFDAAFKACIAASGINLSGEVRVSVHTSSHWTGWTRV